MTPKKEEVDIVDAVQASANLIFDRWDLTEVKVEDPSLERYINLKPVAVLHGSARYANKRFGKEKVSIVERLINSIMRTENYTGKKSKAYRVVRDAFAIIHSRTKTNPIQVMIKALENASKSQHKELTDWLTKKDFDQKDKIEAVISIFKALKIKQLTELKIKDYYKACLSKLKSLNRPEDRKVELYNFASFLMNREK